MRQRSLRTLLIVPFILQIVIAVGLTGFFAFKKGRYAVKRLAEQYGQEIGQGIHVTLSASLDVAYQINAANADALKLGLLKFDDLEGMERYFWQQLQRYENVSYISVGNEVGGIHGVGRTRGATDEGYEYRSYETIDYEGRKFQRGAYHLYRVNKEGVRDPITDEIYVGYNATVRPWYQVAAQARHASWSDIYLYFGESFLGIAASHPVYDDSGRLQGVFSTDLELGQLNDFLGSLKIGHSGEAFIVERTGSIVASSTDENPFTLTNLENRTQGRLLAKDSRQPLIVESIKILETEFGSLGQIPNASADELPPTQVLNLTPDTLDRSCQNCPGFFSAFPLRFEKRYFVQVLPFQHQQGLDWLIVVVLPESDFIDEIHATLRRAIWVGLAMLAIAIVFGIWFLRWVTSPLKCLSQASQAIASGDYSQHLSLDRSQRLSLDRCDEIGILSRSFKQMAQQVQDSVNTLQDQVNERTIHLEAAKKEAETANRAKSQFLANMSHELRTPLNGILGYAQVLQRDSLTPKHQRGLRVIYDCGNHLHSLINEVLDLSKIEAQRMELQVFPLELKPFLAAIADLFRLRTQQKDLQFFYEPHSDLPLAIQADDQKLRQVLINLLGNATKFTDHGSISFRIIPVTAPVTAPITTPATAPAIAENNPEQATIRFQIQDTGRGIAPEHQEVIFQPFQQVGEQRTQDGTGLGLSISYQLVKLMGGTLTLTSEPGQGSCFSFDLDLPIVSDWHPENDPYDCLSTHHIIGFNGPPRRVLIVDDIEENRAFLMDLFSSIGFDVFEADQGQACLDQLKLIRPDVILLDLIMPVMDGFTTVRTIRHDPIWQEFRDLPIIATSASTLHQGKPQSLAAGCDEFLLKPIDTDQLLHIIQTLLKLEWEYGPEPQRTPSLSSSEVPPTFAPSTPHQTQQHQSFNQLSDAAIPPQLILETLWECAQIGDISGILEVLDRCDTPECSPFVTKVRQLAVEFRVKAIQDFLSPLNPTASSKPINTSEPRTG